MPAPQAVLDKFAALESLRAAWEARLLARVRAKVSDAHAHAQKALTDTLKSTPDGRASVLQLNRSPSFAAALGRLDELWAWLTGPSEVSLKGQVRDAREAFLALACDLWFPLVPEEIRGRDAPGPTAAQAREARAWPVHGYDPRKVLEGPIGVAKRTLKAALEQAGRRAATARAGVDLLAAWEARSAASISSAVAGLLNDSVTHADTLAGRGLVHPDYVTETA